MFITRLAYCGSSLIRKYLQICTNSYVNGIIRWQQNFTWISSYVIRNKCNKFMRAIVGTDWSLLQLTTGNILSPGYPYVAHWGLDITATIFTDDIFQCIFLNEICCVLIRFTLKVVVTGANNNNLVLVQIMAWSRTGDKPLCEAVLAYFTDA